MTLGKKGIHPYSQKQKRKEMPIEPRIVKFLGEHLGSMLGKVASDQVACTVMIGGRLTRL
jgi:hypothetical protein